MSLHGALNALPHDAWRAPKRFPFGAGESIALLLLYDSVSS